MEGQLTTTVKPPKEAASLASRQDTPRPSGKKRNLDTAKAGKNDEFYTHYEDIEVEMEAYVKHDADVFRDKVVLLPCDDPAWSNFTKYFARNFSRLGLKRLVSTCIASGKDRHGKILTLDEAEMGQGPIDVDNLQWDWLAGDGDFLSDEVRALRDEADIVVTNPPFSLFRKFFTWVTEADKRFILFGHTNAIAYREVFPSIRSGTTWLGSTVASGSREFRVPDDYELKTPQSRIDEHGNKFIKVGGVRWFTNLEHGQQNQPLPLMTMADRKKVAKKCKTKRMKKARKVLYKRYDNYDAIEVPRTSLIPSDYDGVMGVPISFLDKYCPEQFEIVGLSTSFGRPKDWAADTKMAPSVNGRNIYSRMFIRRHQVLESD